MSASGQLETVASGPRRSGLLQERSRRTRKALVDAAMQLWAEQGLEQEVDNTTVEEIVQAAGVTKGTFYFHFARKEDILLEFATDISDAMFKECKGKLHRGERWFREIQSELVTSLARRITNAAPVAIARAVSDAYAQPVASLHNWGGPLGFRRSFEIVLRWAERNGQLATTMEVPALADVMAAVTISAVAAWLRGEEPQLEIAVHQRVALVLAGVEVATTIARRE